MRNRGRKDGSRSSWWTSTTTKGCKIRHLHSGYSALSIQSSRNLSRSTRRKRESRRSGGCWGSDNPVVLFPLQRTHPFKEVIPAFESDEVFTKEEKKHSDLDQASPYDWVTSSPPTKATNRSTTSSTAIICTGARVPSFAPSIPAPASSLSSVKHASKSFHSSLVQARSCPAEVLNASVENAGTRVRLTMGVWNGSLWPMASKAAETPRRGPGLFSLRRSTSASASWSNSGNVMTGEPGIKTWSPMTPIASVARAFLDDFETPELITSRRRESLARSWTVECDERRCASDRCRFKIGLI